LSSHAVAKQEKKKMTKPAETDYYGLLWQAINQVIGKTKDTLVVLN